MTILGFGIAPTGQRAVVWADTEVYSNKVACGHALKIFGNPAIIAVAAASGPLQIIRAVGAIVQKAVAFDDLIETLRGELRQTFEPEHSLGRAARAPKSASTVVLVGWSEKFGRFVGYVMHRELGFAPLGGDQFTTPHVDDYWGSVDADDIIATATTQFAEVVSCSAIAGDGVLIFVQMAPTEIRMSQLFDLQTGRFLRRPRDFSGYAGDINE